MPAMIMRRPFDLTFFRHSVVTTVRSQAKADKIKEAHPNADLGFAIVPDVAVEVQIVNT